MPLIPFPDAPAVPGVPAILRERTVPSVSELAWLGLGALTDKMFDAPRWGLYDKDLKPALLFDSFLGISFKHGANVSGVPKEKEDLLATDKLSGPLEATIKLAHGGDTASRNAMLSALERIVGSTELYSVVMPEIEYPSVNPVKYSYERGEKNGASLLVVELTLLQVMVKPATESSASKDPSGAKQQSNGQAQTTTLSTGSGSSQNPAETQGTIQ